MKATQSTAEAARRQVSRLIAMVDLVHTEPDEREEYSRICLQLLDFLEAAKKALPKD